MIIHSDLEKLSQVFPDYIKKSLKETNGESRLIEIILDLGRRPEGRFLFESVYLSEQIVSWQDLDYTTKRLGKFSNDNRAGIERTLHRISCIRNRQGIIIGLTCRIGRCVVGSIDILRDLLDSDHSLLLLGKPGVGKTTLIREISRVLSDEIQKRVVIIDTANEIAGDSDIPHAGIGRARRMQVSRTEYQHNLMIEAIENHMPEVIVVDEIGTEFETLAARTIAERGVKLVGTVHGNSLENLIKNPTLSDLIGGIQYVTLSDDEARRRGTQKTILERKFLPAFPIAIELNDKNFWTIHEKVEDSIDRLLQRQESRSQSRSTTKEGRMQIKYSCIGLNTISGLPQPFSLKYTIKDSMRKKKYIKSENNSSLQSLKLKKNNSTKITIYLSCLSLNKITKVYKTLESIFVFTKTIENANIAVIPRVHFNQELYLQKVVKEKNIPLFLTNKNLNYKILAKTILRSILSSKEKKL
jgi:stage III sporulation protein SpoIIIAA